MVTRKLTKLSFEIMGDPFQPFIYGQSNFPMQLAVNYNIPIIMYGENGEVEYGGDMKNAFSPTRDISDHDKHYFSNYPPEFWTKYNITENDLKPFLAPEVKKIKSKNIQIHFLVITNFGIHKNVFITAANIMDFPQIVKEMKALIQNMLVLMIN